MLRIKTLLMVGLIILIPSISFAADTKGSALSAPSGGVARSDKVYVIDDPSGTPVSTADALSNILSLIIDNDVPTTLTLETISGTPVVTNGIAIGTDDTNHLVDEASNGAGSATLYIGNESIIASGDIGVSVQGYDADLSTYAGITPSANVQSLLGAANYAAMRTLMGIDSAANLETSLSLGAYASNILGVANEAGLIALMPNYVDQDVTSGSSPTLDGTNFSGIPIATGITGTEANLYTALSDVTQFYEPGDQIVTGVASTTSGLIDFKNATNAYTLGIQPGATSQDWDITLPTAPSPYAQGVLYSTTGGVLGYIDAGTLGGTPALDTIGNAAGIWTVNSGTYVHLLTMGTAGEWRWQVDASNYISIINDGGVMRLKGVGTSTIDTGTVTVTTDSIFGQTGTTADDDMYFAAYDVDGAAYTNLITLQAANDPLGWLGSETNGLQWGATGAVTFTGTGGITPVPTAADASAIGSATKEYSDLYLADGAVIYLGADQDVSLTHVADTGILLNAAMQFQFRDSAIHIASADDGHLDLTADTSIDLNGPVDAGSNNISTTGVIKGRASYGADITGAVSHDTTATHGVYYHFTAAATATLDAAADAGYGAQVCYYARDDAEAYVIDVQVAEKINLDGTALAAGTAITTSSVGSTVCLVSTTDTDGSGTDGWETWGNNGWASE